MLFTIDLAAEFSNRKRREGLCILHMLVHAAKHLKLELVKRVDQSGKCICKV